MHDIKINKQMKREHVEQTSELIESDSLSRER